MSISPSPTDFDSPPPVPPSEYARMVVGVNVGYDLVFRLAACLLRALQQPHLNLLVVGAGGGMEIEQFLLANPGWRLVGVDPSEEMLSLAAARAERLGVRDRTELVHGVVDDLPAERSFDAAMCLYVLHFLPDDAKLATLQSIGRRLRAAAPLIVASGARVDIDDEDLRSDLLGTWQQHGEMMGLPAEQMAAIVQQILTQNAEATDAKGYLRLLREAGFPRAVSLLNVMNDGMVAWVARR